MGNGICLLVLAVFDTGHAAELRKADALRLHAIACSEHKQSGSKWNIHELYDCTTRELFIPYQLWTGVSWDGDKGAPCMHLGDSRFSVNGKSATTITGPRIWRNPVTGKPESYWSREKVNGSKTQYFTCHERGIGRVYDSRGERHFRPGRCKFPAGYGWELGTRRYCRHTSIEIVVISLDEANNLESLSFKWWYRDKLDYIYRYRPNQGMTDAWRQ